MKKTKTRIKTLLSNLTQPTVTILSVIALIAIIWNVLSFFDKLTQWWCLPLLAVVSGLSSIILPEAAKRLKELYSIISTGISLLVISILQEFTPSKFKFISIGLLLIVISIITDLLIASHKTTTGDLLFDLAVSLIAAAFIYFFNIIIITIPILLVLYTLIMLVRFSRKQKITDTE